MNAIDLVPFLLACIAIELTPGPNMFYIAILSAQHGRSAGYAVAAGVALGLFTVGLLAMLGFSALVAAHPLVYEIIRWAGVTYLVWLAYDTVQDVRRKEPALTPVSGLMRESFLRGLTTNLLNPKAFLFYMSVLPSFIEGGSTNIQPFLILTLIYVAIATGIHLLIVLASGSVSGLMKRRKIRLVMGWSFAGLLLLIAIWVAIQTAR